jgi:hypothetical protein
MKNRPCSGLPLGVNEAEVVAVSAEKVENQRPIVCVDLDGVLNTFDEWRGPEFFHPPRPGAREFLQRLKSAGYRVVIFTVRYHGWVEEWLSENGLSTYVDMVTDRKPPAHVYLDDRAVCFCGDFDEAFVQIVRFRTFWEKI